MEANIKPVNNQDLSETQNKQIPDNSATEPGSRQQLRDEPAVTWTQDVYAAQEDLFTAAKEE